MTRIITIFGATGTQGSAVINSLLADGTFTPRAVTRNPDSEAAKKLKERGAEVVKADLWNLDSVTNAIRGSEAVFGVTNFWDPEIFPNNPKGEIEQGKNLVDASKAAGVKFLVWSSLPNASEVSKGKYTKILHFDYKAAIEEYIKQSGVPHAVLHTGWFIENLWTLQGLVKKPDGNFDLIIPCFATTTTQASTLVKSDFGPCALAVFKNYERSDVQGQTFHAVTAQINYPELAGHLSKAFGKDVTFVSPPTTGIEELDEMFKYQSEIGMYRDSPIPDPRLVALGVKFTTMNEVIDEVGKHFSHFCSGVLIGTTEPSSPRNTDQNVLNGMAAMARSLMKASPCPDASPVTRAVCLP